MHNTIVAMIRTGVAAAVGGAVVWANHQFGVEIDSALVAVPAVAFVTAVYNGVVIALTKRWPTFGWFLGVPTTPVYPKADAGT